MSLIDEESVRTIRSQLPALDHAVYLNTGTAGPLPEEAADALQDAFAAEVSHGRIGPTVWQTHRSLAAETRQEVADLLRTAPDRLALMHHTTDGLNAAGLGIPWGPGDALVTTDLEHAAVQLVVGALRARYGIEVRIARLVDATSPSEAAEAVARQMNARVRAIFLSHVSYASGFVLPLAEIAHLARRFEALLVVDGAQSVGALEVHPGELGADFYTVSGQKWLCGPEGTGALWVAPGQEERLRPGAMGYAGVATVDAEGYYQPHPGARRLEVGTVFHPGLAGWTASLRWLSRIGWPQIWARTYDLAEMLRTALGEIPSVTVLTPPEHAGLVSFRVANVAAEDAVRLLGSKGFLVRSIPGWDAIRVSCGFFLQEEEIERVASEVAVLGR